MPEWLLRWSQSALTFVIVLTVVSAGLLGVPLKEAILVDFAYMLITFLIAWRRKDRH
ncbi:hypothetical protein [Lactiplantibacillus pentosus]|uniref:hypothetical protein n=1 Tax=Lactiplantibacillus pentosus TaxID=1589 RepID=UPI001C1F47D5|nr:hypothetical protein [Lactiplantibacillus pentosus]MBU7493694.1 hypothetical protein [Lactiplantibacillus pentosus]